MLQEELAEFELELGQFLLEHGVSLREGENDMADSSADFSKILELREIRRLYEESQERFRQEMADRDSYIENLKAQIALMDSSGVRSESERSLKEERDKLAQQLSFQKQEYEAKVEKLQLRIKELSSHAAAGDPARSGFFRR